MQEADVEDEDDPNQLFSLNDLYNLDPEELDGKVFIITGEEGSIKSEGSYSSEGICDMEKPNNQDPDRRVPAGRYV